MASMDELDPANFGIFAGSQGLSDIDHMEVAQTPEAFVLRRSCESCGKKCECQIAWSEMYCLQYGIDPFKVGSAINRSDIFPTQWVYDSRVKCFHPNYKHGCTGNPLVVFNMTPTQAERALHEAGRNGIMSDDQKLIIRFISPTVRQMSGASSGVPAQQVQQAYRQAVPQPMAGVPVQGPHPVPQYPNGPPAYYPPGYPQGGQRR